MGKDLFNDRISRFSIRKLNVGVCSVLLGTLVRLGQPQVQPQKKRQIRQVKV